MRMVMRAALMAGSFSPAALFRSGEVGAWYDPSDLTTMFQDAAGTTPVTAVGQPVGLILDKSGTDNHASQSTSTARPLLSARVNLLTYSEQFDNAAWTKSGMAAFGSGSVANAIAAPDGTTTADKIVGAATTALHAVYQNFTGTANVSYTISVYAKAAEYSKLIINEIGGGRFGAWWDLADGTFTSNAGAGFVSQSITAVGNGWYRCTVTATVNGTGTSWAVTIAGFPTGATVGTSAVNYTGDGASGIYVWGADLRPTNQTTGIPTYQRIAAATDYDTSGFPYYLSFDGTDDFLVTGTISPGSVDKAQVFAGVRKLSDAARGTVAELSTSIASNNGAFHLTAPNAASATMAFESKGTTLTDAVASSLTAPLTRVVTGLGDISGDTATIRINGVQADQDTGDQGTGNYGSYPLYIGRRAGTSLPYNGNLYGLIVRFSAANLADADITKTETWMNTKTGAY